MHRTSRTWAQKLRKRYQLWYSSRRYQSPSGKGWRRTQIQATRHFYSKHN